ncbi:MULTISPECIES: TonB system transport protein ExbD [unclassified Bradyrhizobium]|uniref:TonB system transport protein ExbD n=1 Tax=unclassified Bradyrhizobium TaxID=2631580 RepID=UPI0028E70E98|nr:MULTISPECIES: TonB system transport protein ExbD [unclassified Bradyrhizobium]
MAIRLAKRDDEFAETHEINVTPFIDVMLVLLIIFMVAAPLATVDIPVNLPSASAEPAARPDKPIFVTFRADHSLAVDDGTVARDELAAALDAATNSDRNQRVLLRADQALSYGEVMDVMNLLRNAGYTKVALVAVENRGSP